MTNDISTLVFPGGDTRCIFSYSTPYAFQVIPGSSDKLLFYFQGGGACWDEISTKLGFCTSDVSPQSPVGVFDRTDVRNEFRDYTIVHLSYCSGDVWGGNVVQRYTDKDGVPVQQSGLANAAATLSWVASQQKAGTLSNTFSKLVVMGCSAGSVGAQLWAAEVLSTLKWSVAAVVPDSYAGVFPPGSQGPLIRGYGFCTWNALDKTLYKKCVTGVLTIQEINDANQFSNPNTPFAFIQSKVDYVQQSFYLAIGATTRNTSAKITPANFYNNVTDIFGTYSQDHKNFVTYLVDGPNHCFTNQERYYTADCLGPYNNNKTATDCSSLYAWTGSLPLSTDEDIATQCEGEIVDTSSANNDMTEKEKLSYCSTSVIPKTFEN